jgi:hypothetical protein
MKGLRIIHESPASSGAEPSRTLYPNTSPSDRCIPIRYDSDDSSWDVIDDLPLRWATSYVPLAPPGSRLANTTVHLFTLYNDEAARTKGATLLAVVTKGNILLYEAPWGERAFRFVKVSPVSDPTVAFRFLHMSSLGLLRPDAASKRHLCLSVRRKHTAQDYGQLQIVPRLQAPRGRQHAAQAHVVGRPVGGYVRPTTQPLRRL